MKMPRTNANLIFVLIFFTTIWNIGCGKLSGPSVTILKKIEKCNSTEGHTIILDKYRINKYNKTVYTYTGNVSVLEELNDERADVNLMVDVWGNGGWRKNVFNKIFKKACSTVKVFFPNYIGSVFQQANITGCPIPKGTYVLKDLIVDMDVAVPVSYGSYRATIEFVNSTEEHNKVFFCMVAYIDIVPKDTFFSVNSPI